MGDAKARRGRKPEAASAQKSSFIKVRVTESEKESIARSAAENGFTVSSFVRRRALGAPDRPACELAEMVRLRSELRYQGNNINQIAHALNSAMAQGRPGSALDSEAARSAAAVERIQADLARVLEETEMVFGLI